MRRLLFLPTVCAIWSTNDGRIIHNGTPYRIRGINWSGTESNCRVPHLLWDAPASHYWDLLQDHGFNSIRLPLPYEIFWNPDQSFVQNGCVAASPELRGFSVEDMIWHWLDEAHRRNMTVLLEMHTIQNRIQEGPWSEFVPKEDVTGGWVAFAERYASHPAIIGFGLKNEVHGRVTLDQFFDWAADTINAIEAAAPHNKLYFLSGAQYSHNDLGLNNPWGGSIADITSQGPPVSDSFVDLTHPNALCIKLGDTLLPQVVFEPHVYGPDVIPGSYPDESLWDTRFGFIRHRDWHWKHTPIVFTEIGGRLQGSDAAYYEAFLSYAERNNFTDAYWWTLGISGDTGGLTEDYDVTVPIPYKIDYMKRFQPNPTGGVGG